MGVSPEPAAGSQPRRRRGGSDEPPGPLTGPGLGNRSAAMRAIDAEGRSSFEEYMVPLMTLALKQGFGRLIRLPSLNSFG